MTCAEESYSMTIERVQEQQEKVSRRVSKKPPVLYVLRLSNWIAFHAVASNGPITVADGADQPIRLPRYHYFRGD